MFQIQRYLNSKRREETVYRSNLIIFIFQGSIYPARRNLVSQSESREFWRGNKGRRCVSRPDVSTSVEIRAH